MTHIHTNYKMMSEEFNPLYFSLLLSNKQISYYIEIRGLHFNKISLSINIM